MNIQISDLLKAARLDPSAFTTGTVMLSDIFTAQENQNIPENEKIRVTRLDNQQLDANPGIMDEYDFCSALTLTAKLVNPTNERIFLHNGDRVVCLEPSTQATHSPGHLIMYLKEAVTRADSTMYTAAAKRYAHRSLEKSTIPGVLLKRNKTLFHDALPLTIALSPNMDGSANPATTDFRNIFLDSVERKLIDYKHVYPFDISANDPTGRHKEIFVLVGTEILSCYVTNYENLQGAIKVKRRYKNTDEESDIVAEYINFEDVLDIDNTLDTDTYTTKAYCDKGLYFSTSRTRLEKLCFFMKKESETMIAKTAFDKQLRDVTENLTDEVTSLRKKLKKYEEENYSLQSSVWKLEDQNRKQSVKLSNKDFATTKRDAIIFAVKNRESVERSERARSIVSSFVDLFKTAVAVVTALVSAYGFYLKQKAKI